MEISQLLPNELTCSHCHFRMNQPCDSCPQCGDHLYWMLEQKGMADSQREKAFLDLMVNLVGKEAAARAYLIHDNQFWLPYNFWSNDPGGITLFTFPWLNGLEKIQQDPELPEDSDILQQVTDRPEESPVIQGPQNIEGPLLVVDDMVGSVFPTPESEPEPDPIPLWEETPPPLEKIEAQACAESPPLAPLSALEEEVEAAPQTAATPPQKTPKRPDWQIALTNPPKEAIPPIALTLFLVLLAATYVVLQYHRFH